MKRFTASIFVTLLSALIIYWGAGALVTQCLHSGVVSLGLSTEAHTDDEPHSHTTTADGAESEHPTCLVVSIEKLSPSVQLDDFYLPPPVVISILFTLFAVSFCSLPATEADILTRNMLASPPLLTARAYLRKITVLQI